MLISTALSLKKSNLSPKYDKQKYESPRGYKNKRKNLA